MADFNKIIGFIRAKEGGYANVAGDRGGETYAGISRRYHPKWAGWVIIDKSKPIKHNHKLINTALDAMITDFYRVNFWNAIAGDRIESQAVANMAFDWQVTSDDGCTRTMQRIAGVKPDGVVGEKTIQAINACADMLPKLKQARIDFYKNIAGKDPTQRKFLKGWLARVEAVPMG